MTAVAVGVLLLVTASGLAAELRIGARDPARRLSASTPVNDGLPRTWFGVIKSLFVFDYYGQRTTIKTLSRVRFTLSEVERNVVQNSYLYRPTGVLEASMERTGGECSWRGSGTVPLKPFHGVLQMRVIKSRGQRTFLEYGADSPGAYNTRAPTIPATLRCPKYTHRYPEAIHWTGIPQSSRGKPKAQLLRGTWNYRGDAEGFRTWCLTRKLSDLESCEADKLEAVARVSGSAARASTRMLDGSRSKGDIKRYEWTFEQADCTGGACAGYCDTVGPKPGAKKRGARVTIKPLCAVQATLTVSDGEDEDSDTVLVPVTPRARDWRTQVLHRWIPTPTGARSDAPRGEPVAKCSADGSCTVEIHGGLNVPDPQGCSGQEVLGSRIVCPLLGTRKTWKGQGYTLATIADPGGPFDGYSFVQASTLVVKRLAYINPALLSGPFYDYNKAHQGQVDALLEATKQHEGFGISGKPGTGHSQIMRDIINGSGGLNDPRHELERMFAPAASTVQELADKEIKRIDELADTRSDDPLQHIGRFALWFYDPVDGTWTPGLISIP